MDEKQTENPSTLDRLDNTNIPVIAVTANLEMLAIETNPPPTETKRVLRKKIPKPVTTEHRRCSLRLKKRKISEVSLLEAQEDKNIKNYYLDKKIDKKSKNLETIYEENDNLDDDAATYMSAKRFKRMLMFSPASASKLKKRRAKIQRVFGSKIRYKRCSMQTLVDKLNTIRENSPMKLDSDLKSEQIPL